MKERRETVLLYAIETVALVLTLLVLGGFLMLASRLL